ncbi:amidase family protein [Bacillus marasmi]|uniref:amidase family protein n=1 Tax=Bacillus marasmi TaxID=1926279 RepID=UPI0011C8DFC4|nr:amidase family protein [Bacillus marasmi]
MAIFPYKYFDGVGLAQLISGREITVEEVLEAAIKEIEMKNPELNAVINKTYEGARAAIKEKTQRGDFTGIPILLKDIAQDIRGEPITRGSKAFRDVRAIKDSTFVERIKQTGMMIVGQTNVPELGLMGITEPIYYGPTRNPWNLNHSPGGSSGGSAAAVASGMVPIAGASDGGGSIRIPAAFCGLFGIKPTRGRTPVGKGEGRHWHGAAVNHVLTRTVRDSALMLDYVKGYEKGAAFHCSPYDTSYSKILKVEFQRSLRIAFSTKSPIGKEVDPECKQAVLKTAKLLESMGHIVEEVEAPVDGKKIANSYMTLYFGEVAAQFHDIEKELGRKVTYKDVEPATYILGLIGKVITADEFVLSIREWDKAAFAMEQFHETYDFFMTPTTAFPPTKIGELDPTNTEKRLINLIGKLKLQGVVRKMGLIDEMIENSLKRTPFTQLANLTGQPAMSVPLHINEQGLPVGVQFMTANGREDLLFQMANLLEQTDEWIDITKNSNY